MGATDTVPTELPSVSGNKTHCCDEFARTKKHSYSCKKHPWRRDLKPCAFCGNEAEILPQSDATAGRCREWLIRCTRCACRMTVFTSFITSVRAEWNYRKKDSNAAHS